MTRSAFFALFFALFAALCGALVVAALAAAPQALAADAPQFDILQRADGARLTPDRFLRDWDPVTVFFPSDVGPAAGGPEDAPQRLVRITPQPPGAWTWLGSRALQFRPAMAWTPLRPLRIEAQGLDARLIPLLPEPVAAEPPATDGPIAELDHITLSFAEPVDVAALARLITIEIRPAPGLTGGAGQFLSAQDFSVLPLARGGKDERQAYLIQFAAAAPDARVAILRLRLSGEAGLDEPSYELRLETAAPFLATEARCGTGFEAAATQGLLQCRPDSDDEPRSRALTLAFNVPPALLDPTQARDALRLSPPVEGFAVVQDGVRLRISGRFLSDVAYQLDVAAGAVADQRRRPLSGPFAQRFAFAAARPHLAFEAHEGIVERFGPQAVPMRGAGYDKADLRIYAIDPLSRDFWPFPAEGVETDDAAEPPLPGAGPSRWTKADDVDRQAISERIRALGSPAISELAPLPIRRQGAGAKFGLDLKPHLARIRGPEEAGAYLVGVRPIGAARRSWMRLQATDLALATVEEPQRVRFVVTSLASAKPVEGATVTLEGLRGERYETLVAGRTDADGVFTWSLAERAEATIRRIVVAKGLDALTLAVERGPAEYARENWTRPSEAWLGWTVDPEIRRVEAPRTLCHLFVDRPIYRPEEPARIKGYVRRYAGGALSYARGGGVFVVRGPDGQEWRLPTTIDANGAIYQIFDAQTQATGDYAVAFEPDAAARDKDRADDAGGAAEEEGEAASADAQAQDAPVSCGATSFKKEAYRLPTFEALLNAPESVPLDREFSVELLARYFAGGLVADRPLKWRASQFPYVWTPPGREGWFFSTDSRFSADGKFRSTPVLERQAATDEAGAARIGFDPSAEPTAQPRRYQIEATVSGEDGLEVRNVVSVLALPPFALGLKLPRYQKAPGPIAADALAVDARGAPLEGVEITARLVRRNWSSTLQATDFTQGAAKYVTEVIDEPVEEAKLISGAEPQRLAFKAAEAGVYLVELEALDRSGRRQKVAVDFFVGGGSPATFARAPSQTAEIAADKDAYAPGETATLIVQSPFQNARALAIVEDPSGLFRTQWVAINNGFGRFEFALKAPDLPRLAVHFLIMRGRLPQDGAPSAAPFDQGKPVTIAATKWIAVTPVKNIVTVALDYPKKARPGQEIEVALKLSDDLGRPLAGEATFWMVDQAVLSLAKEKPLDPLPSFIVDRPSAMAARDTRNMAFGVIPLDETPGGDAGLEEWGSDSNVSVRKNFTPVPVYLPKVVVGPDGTARIKVRLPDSLTVFKLRAKAASGPDRFGYGVGEMLIRQDLVAQPALPRFLRQGDSFMANFLGRVVEGPAGAGEASLDVSGLSLEGSARREIAFEQNRPARIGFRAAVGEGAVGDVRLRFALRRAADQARDAIEIALPVKPDRSPARERWLVEIAPSGAATIASPGARARPGSLERSLVVASDPVIVRLIAGLGSLTEYPYGCTEQRISLASAGLALKPFEPVLATSRFGGRLSQDVRNTVVAIAQSVDGDGLVAFWPRARGNVSLTAWAYGFLAAAQRAGEPIDQPLFERLGATLRQSLRSDFARLRDGQQLRERVEALNALAGAGRLDEAYVAELSRDAGSMPNAAVAQMAQAATQLPGEGRKIAASLVEEMWTRIKLLNRDGVEVYAGQTGDGGDPEILTSETRSLAEMTRAAALVAPSDPRSAALRTALLRLGDGDGWGDVNASSAAMRALAAVWRAAPMLARVTATQGERTQLAVLGPDAPVLRLEAAAARDIRLANAGAAPVVALYGATYLPAGPGAAAPSRTQGFALARRSWRVAGGAPPAAVEPDADGTLRFNAGDLVEETVELVNPQDRAHVAIVVPLAAGFEPLNPALANAPREAAASFAPTLAPTWSSFGDDQAFYAYDFLPKGNYRFAFRVRAMTEGSFTQPPGEAQMMYRADVNGSSAGRRIVIAR